MKDTFELLGSIHHLKGDYLDTIFDQSLVTEGKEISLQVGGSLKTIPVASVKGVLTRRIKKMFYLLRRHIDEEGVGHLLGEGIVITGGKVLEYPGLVELGEEVLHQPLRIRKFELAGLGNEYATAYGILRLIHDSEYKHKGCRKLVSNLWERFLSFFDKYF
jgi:cell division ATPase FtsA